MKNNYKVNQIETKYVTFNIILYNIHTENNEKFKFVHVRGFNVLIDDTNQIVRV